MSKRKPVNLEQAQKIANFWLNETGGNAEEAFYLAAMSGGLKKVKKPYTPPAPGGRPSLYGLDLAVVLHLAHDAGRALLIKAGSRYSKVAAFEAAIKKCVVSKMLTELVVPDARFPPPGPNHPWAAYFPDCAGTDRQPRKNVIKAAAGRCARDFNRYLKRYRDLFGVSFDSPMKRRRRALPQN